MDTALTDIKELKDGTSNKISLLEVNKASKEDLATLLKELHDFKFQ